MYSTKGRVTYEAKWCRWFLIPAHQGFKLYNEELTSWITSRICLKIFNCSIPNSCIKHTHLNLCFLVKILLSTFFLSVSDKSVLIVINGILKYWGNMPEGGNYNSITNIFPWLAFWTLLPLALQLCLMSEEIIQMSPKHSIISEALAILSRLLSQSGSRADHPSLVTWPCVW